MLWETDNRHQQKADLRHNSINKDPSSQATQPVETGTGNELKLGFPGEIRGRRLI